MIKRKRGRPKHNPMAKSPKTKLKMKKSALKRWAKRKEKKNKIGILKVAKKIKDEDRQTWKEHEEQEKNPNCPFCKNEMQPTIKGYYYCKTCNMIINPALRWRVKLPI